MSTKSRERRSPSTAQLFRIAYNLLSQDVFSHVSASGFSDLRPSHGNVLEHLTFSEEARLSAMATAAGMTAQSLGELVDDLERRGYVERREDPADRRAKLVRLTAKGRGSVRAAAEATAAAERQLRRQLGSSDYLRMRAIAMRIAESGESTGDDRPLAPAESHGSTPPPRPGKRRVKTPLART